MTQSLYSRRTLEDQLDLRETINAVKKAFEAEARGRTQMPSKVYLEFPEHHGDLRTMPSHVSEFPYATVKLVNAHPNNPEQFNLPTVMALLLAYDPKNGLPVAILDATKITSLRTAAASALATERFARADARSIGLLGTGSQAKDQLRANLMVRDIHIVNLYDKNQTQMNSFGDWVNEQFPQFEINLYDDPETTIKNSDVVVSLTPSTEPIAKFDHLPDSLHVNAMGADAPNKREWSNQLLKSFDVVVDNWEQASHSGEISHLVENGTITEDRILCTLGEALVNEEIGHSGRTLFDSTGLAIQDNAAANAFLEKNVDPDAEFDFLNLDKEFQ